MVRSSRPCYVRLSHWPWDCRIARSSASYGHLDALDKATSASQFQSENRIQGTAIFPLGAAWPAAM